MSTNKKEIENESVTGLDAATNRKDAEYDLVSALLKAADYKNDEALIHEVDIKRDGEFRFRVHLHPVSDPDARFARKQATTYAPHPNGKKFGQIEKDFNNSLFGSWLIYLSTTEEDQKNIWGNEAVKNRFNLALPVEGVDVLLTMGEKRKLLDIVSEISGISDDDDEDENKNMDEETFQ